MRLLLIVSILLLCQTATVGAGMKIAILRDSFPAKACFADPERLARVLRQVQDAQLLRQAQDAEVEFITADQLADPAAFNADKYWLVVLPYGPYFPAQARENFLAYLRGGGDFLSTGGYAFDEPMMRWKGQWLAKSQALRLIPTGEVLVGSEADRDYLTGEWNNPEGAQKEWGGETATKRWSGKSAGLRLTVDPSKRYTLELLVAINHYAARSRWSLTVNGKAIMDIPEGSGQTLRVPLGPEQFAGKSELNIGFKGKLWRPSDVSNSTDDRLLGIAVSRVRLIPDGPVEPQPDVALLSKPLNMRKGKPNDFLEWDKQQLGVFDAGYRLTGGQSVSPAPDQHIIPAGFSVKAKIEGWAAAGTTGSEWYWTVPTHRSRLIPLLATKDEFGRDRGSAGSLMVNTLEPYRGSIWAYFGVESRDLFSDPGSDQMLLSVVNAMKRGVFLHDLHPSYACYRQGEEAVITGSVSNLGRDAVSCVVQMDIEDESGSPMHGEDIRVDLAPGETKEISTRWHPGLFPDDFYTVKADLRIGGKTVDTIRSGFYAWNAQTLANGIGLSYSRNYLRDNGRPRYMLGAQTFYDKVCPTGMNPLDVERDFKDMADMGLHVARTFTFSSDTETDRRFVDALVMASQRHRVAFFLAGTVWMQAYLTDPSLISIASGIGERYRGIEGVMIDLFNEPDFQPGEETLRDARFNACLQAKYGSNDALRAAWGDELGKDEQLGSIKMGWITREWTSIRSRDIYRFLLGEGSKWVTDVTGAIKAKDPSRLVSVGYLQWWNGMMMDAAVTSDALDFVDRHWYGKLDTVREFDASLAMSDRRYRGKAPSTGEFGSKTFPTFAETGHNFDSVEQQELRYLHIGHYTLALGGVFTSNWHWRDPQGSIFPYGIVQSDWTPKPVTKAYRAMSLLFTGIKPKYVEPEVYLVLPDESRFGGGCELLTRSTMRAANGLIDARLRFGVIGEWDLGRLPKPARLLVFPSLFAMSENAYQQLTRFVYRGGTLYVSGDFSYDENRKRTQTSRLDIAGVRFDGENYPDVRFEKGKREQITYEGGLTYQGYPSMRFWMILERRDEPPSPNDWPTSIPSTDARLIAKSSSGPVAVIDRFGKGKVFFSSDPAELYEGAPLDQIYLLAAREAGVQPEIILSLSKDAKGIQMFRLPCEDGEAVMVGNAGAKAARVSVRVGGHDYSVFIAANRQATLVTKGGKLVGLESQGDVTRGGVTLAHANHHFFAVALDGQDLSDSREIAFVGLRAGDYSVGRTGLIAEAGEVRGGKWHAMKDLGGGLAVPQSLAGDVVLLASRDVMARARESVTGLLAR